MDNKIVIFKSLDSLEYLSKVFGNLSKEDNKCIDKFLRSFIHFGYIEDDCSKTVAIVDDAKISAMIDFMYGYELKFEVQDITKDVLYSKVDLTDIKSNGADNTFHFFEFTDALECFINTHLTIDMILDKISISGVESLTEKEKIVLEDV